LAFVSAAPLALAGTPEPGAEVAPADPRLPVEAWRSELSLSEKSVADVQEVDRWLAEERGALRAAKEAGELGLRDLIKRQRKLQQETRARLSAVLTPEQLALVDFKAIFPSRMPALLLTFSSGVAGSLASGFDEGPGHVSTSSMRVGADARFALSDSLSLNFGVTGTATRFDFSDAFELDPQRGDPFEKLYSGQLSLGLTWQINQSWTAFATTFTAATGEQDASFRDSLTFGGFGGLSYSFNEQFSLGFGISFRTRLEDDPQIIPLPIVRLEIEFTEQLKLSLGVPQGIRLTYAPLPELEISVTGGPSGLLNLPDARLDDDGFAPNGVFRQTSIPLTLVVDWRPLPILKVSFEGGVVVYRKFEIDDARGHSLTKVKTDPTAYFQLSLSLTF
tara:strand:- start:677 stop:1849 length:1173 start_codon:yes stop_codon:yes gene_type:complete